MSPAAVILPDGPMRLGPRGARALLELLVAARDARRDTTPASQPASHRAPRDPNPEEFRGSG